MNSARLMTEVNEMIVRRIHAHGHVSRAELAPHVGAELPTTRSLSRRLEHLANQGWIEVADGKRHSARWAVTPEAKPWLAKVGRLPSRPMASRFQRGPAC